MFCRAGVRWDSLFSRASCWCSLAVDEEQAESFPWSRQASKLKIKSFWKQGCRAVSECSNTNKIQWHSVLRRTKVGNSNKSLLFLQSLISRFTINKELFYNLTKWYIKLPLTQSWYFIFPHKAFTFFFCHHLEQLAEHVSNICKANPRTDCKPA